jgi:predicted RNase H-like HicB family nuclease
MESVVCRPEQHERYRCLVREVPGEAMWVAEFPDVPGCFATGKTRAEALEASDEALARWLDRADKLGISRPKPGSGNAATGQVRIRTLSRVQRDLAEIANHVRLSRNEVTTQLLYKAVARDFDQDVLVDSSMCTLIGPSQDMMRRPRSERFDIDGHFSGQWLQRLPPQLHLQLIAWAGGEGVSPNLLINCILVREIELWKTTWVSPQKSEAA